MLQRITQTKMRFTLLILASLAIILGVIQNTQAQIRVPRPVPPHQLPLSRILHPFNGHLSFT